MLEIALLWCSLWLLAIWT